jgi:hypothetical protein
MNIGVAAHICAAAPGPGARRYDPNLTPEERSSINNGIWLCAACATIIDRDETTYPAARLREMKRRHEESRRLDPNRGSVDDSDDVIAIGPEIVGIGEIIASGTSGLKVRLHHFVIGNGRDLISFAGDFEKVPARDRYVLLNELGYGRTLCNSPEVTKIRSGYEVIFALNPSEVRKSAESMGASMCRHTGQMIRGIEVFTQHLESLLGLAIGDNVFHPRSGTRISQFYKDYAGSPWLERFIKMEIARLASIPIPDSLFKTNVTPLICVNCVRKLEIPTTELEGQCLRARLGLELEGTGYWERDIQIFIYSDEQLEAASRREIPEMLRGLID